MAPRPRPHLAAIGPVFHGGASAADRAVPGRRSEAEFLDFSVSVNPLGPPPGVRRVLRELNPDVYPDPRAEGLINRLAERDGVPATHLLPGNGSSEVIWLAAQAFLAPGEAALIVGPTYGEYARAARQAGAAVVEWRANPADGFAVHPIEVIQAARRVKAQAVFLANPNNPTGHRLDPAAVRQIAGELPDTLIALDEAYLPLVAGADLVPDRPLPPNLLRLRSLTKDGGLAGLRLGYALAGPELLQSLAALQPPWSVNGAAQAAGIAVLTDPGHRAATLATLAEGRAILESGLAELGLVPVPSPANFLIVPVGDAAAVRQLLLRQGICVRDCASFGLPEYIRIGIRRPGECRRLIAALAEVIRVVVH